MKETTKTQTFEQTYGKELTDKVMALATAIEGAVKSCKEVIAPVYKAGFEIYCKVLKIARKKITAQTVNQYHKAIKPEILKTHAIQDDTLRVYLSELRTMAGLPKNVAMSEKAKKAAAEKREAKTKGGKDGEESEQVLILSEVSSETLCATILKMVAEDDGEKFAVALSSAASKSQVVREVVQSVVMKLRKVS